MGAPYLGTQRIVPTAGINLCETWQMFWVEVVVAHIKTGASPPLATEYILGDFAIDYSGPIGVMELTNFKIPKLYPNTNTGPIFIFGNIRGY